MKKFFILVIIVTLIMFLSLLGFKTHIMGSLAAPAPDCFFSTVLAFKSQVLGEMFSLDDNEHKVGFCFEVVDKDGNLLTKMSRKPRPGDEVLMPEGDRYRVVKVRDRTATAELKGKDEEYLKMVSYFEEMKELPVVSQSWSSRPVAIYHTHSDESYVPSDGRASIPYNGGIFQVGSTFARSMKDRRIRALHDLTPHDPHDAFAYMRSRRTAVSLIKNTNPIALFDVHRDGIDDPEFFREVVAQEDIAQIRIVVGRQNPKMSANLDFAKRLMAYARKKYPGLVKEIFMAHGNYNQDLMSTALLLEAGTYTNYKSRAQEGIAFLAETVPVVLGITAPGLGITSRGASAKALLTALGLIVLVLTALGAFIVINAGPGEIAERVQDVKKRLREKIRFLLRERIRK